MSRYGRHSPLVTTRFNHFWKRRAGKFDPTPEMRFYRKFAPSAITSSNDIFQFPLILGYTYSDLRSQLNYISKQSKRCDWIDSNMSWEYWVIVLNRRGKRNGVSVGVWLGVVNFFLRLYCVILNRLVLPMFSLTMVSGRNRRKALYRLHFRTLNRKLMMSVQYKHNKNLLFLSPGLFIKFFEKNKALKRGKLVKLLMVKYLQRVLVYGEVNGVVFYFRHNVTQLPEILSLLKLKLRNNTKTDLPTPLSSPFYIFANNKSFTINKLKLRGRVKRRILRKIITRNRLID